MKYQATIYIVYEFFMLNHDFKFVMHALQQALVVPHLPYYQVLKKSHKFLLVEIYLTHVRYMV